MSSRKHVWVVLLMALPSVWVLADGPGCGIVVVGISILWPGVVGFVANWSGWLNG